MIAFRRMWSGQIRQPRRRVPAAQDPQQQQHMHSCVRWTVLRNFDEHRSLTWLVRACDERTINISCAQLNGRLTLRQYQGSWFIDYVGDFARNLAVPVERAAIEDYWIRVPCVGGWRLAAGILIPNSMLVAPCAEEPIFNEASTHRWNPPADDSVLDIEIFYGAEMGNLADLRMITVDPERELIGQITAVPGVSVAVVARTRQMNAAIRAIVNARPRESAYPVAFSNGWQLGGAHPVPYVIDLRATASPIRAN